MKPVHEEVSEFHDEARETRMIQHITREALRMVEQTSVAKIATVGAAGTATTATAAAIDPVYVASWMQVGAVGVSILVGLATLVLVLLKIIQERRRLRGGPPPDQGGLRAS